MLRAARKDGGMDSSDDERYERRLVEETSKLRVELAGVEVRLTDRIAQSEGRLLRWSFVFWLGQVVALSAILSARPQAATRLYGTDLLGAALGCVLSIPLISTIDPPRTIILAGVILSAGGIPMSLGRPKQLAAGAMVTAFSASSWGRPNATATPASYGRRCV